MTATSKRSGGPSSLDPQTIVVWAAVALVVVVVGAISSAAHIGARIDHDHRHLPGNPIELTVGLLKGTVEWPHSAPIVLVAIGTGAVGIGAVGLLLAARMRSRRTRVDRAASRMGRGRDLASLTAKGARATASRLGVDSPGLPIGQTVLGGRALYSNWEDVSVDIWGPRTGKTTSRAIPAILAAPGAVLATSNKRDLVDATRDPRSARGEVWVFDPQGIVGEPATWWWNPLTYVTDEVKAAILAGVFAAAVTDPDARIDAYFEPAARELLANLLLAAAIDSRPITQVYMWLTDPTNDEAVEILRPDFPLTSASLAGVVNAPEKQRGGVFGTAQQIASFMTNRQAMSWATSGGADDRRREFKPRAFVDSSDTLYSLSKEGQGSAGALVTALTVAVCEAAEDLAKRTSGGRLPVPLVAVLDEAANVCRWRELPNLYSHYGSRGIVILTILQSWSQGVEVWGVGGMRKLWSAANVKVYGGGVAESDFLEDLSRLIGDFDLTTTSVTYGAGGRSTNRSTRRERTLDIADLAALPRGRAIVLASGTPATLIRTLPWMTGPHAAAIAASIKAHDPAGPETLADHEATRAWLADEGNEAIANVT
jgi:type IV secretory pathway TraG/TraD family ATPase VirD4